MKPYQRALAYLTVAAGLGGAGCEKEPSPLEQQVQASEVGLKVAPNSELHGRLVSSEQELDLSTPEKFVDVYISTFNKELKGEVELGYTMRTLFHGYKEIDLTDQIRTVQNTRDKYDPRIDDYKVLNIKTNSKGHMEVAIEMRTKGRDRKTGKLLDKTAKQTLEIVKVGEGYKLIHW